MLQHALKARSILHTKTKPWQDRVLEARELLAELGDAVPTTFAAQVRRALAEDSRRVHPHLAGLRDIEFSGTPGDFGFEQWRAWSTLQGVNAEDIPAAFELPPVGPARNSIVSDLDPQSRYRAFEASTMMAMRKSLRRGSAWVDHSIGFRPRESMLLAPEDWAGSKEQHLQILGLPGEGSSYFSCRLTR